eukprot:CAMPEP_0201612194 /NCGR_PEP_ID=MMETSP0492-20130828/22361_1 /ASSEMBLY_ACC=CAM_ASM_000837 /TAXON_ID=420259 /ORGANISM="Thalassiosira gravida, Strain GMp14c1" /LENGTH=57 /DNA_ID=CAMNT_0048078621 /DNA_START=330 /DNA_END=500 /DNA_ORIENTATION=-
MPNDECSRLLRSPEHLVGIESEGIGEAHLVDAGGAPDRGAGGEDGGSAPGAVDVYPD